jgi:hypothetical protein
MHLQRDAGLQQESLVKLRVSELPRNVVLQQGLTVSDGVSSS